jgi:diaminohydroxyphosphoribosylaminopyrimidine deaminase/5-amino-6-(5-phosphoribosylamino)uracil reductase
MAARRKTKAEPAPLDPELDRRFMAAALRIGRRNLGQTRPNPAVGAIVVRMDGAAPIVVGRGATAAGGRPHAETIALAEAGKAARGATLYVTLEPCAHQGKTPPCANAIVAAGIARVVCAMADPDPRVMGRGYEILAKAGVALTTDVLAAEAALAHAGHVARVTRGRPHVTLKLAVSADGMIGKREGGRMIISGGLTFDAVQAMRAESDAIMIGIGTALVDDPRLTVRLPGMESRSPVRVVIDTTAKLPFASKLVASAKDPPLIVIVGPDAPVERREVLAAAGVKIIEVGAASGGVDLGQALEALAAEGLTRVLAEGGAGIAASLIAGELADEVVIFRAPVVVGADGVRALGSNPLSAIERSPRYRPIEAAIFGEDQMRRYLRTP